MAKQGRNRFIAFVETIAGVALTGVSTAVVVQNSGILDQVGAIGASVGIGVAIHGFMGTSPRQRP